MARLVRWVPARWGQWQQCQVRQSWRQGQQEGRNQRAEVVARMHNGFLMAGTQMTRWASSRWRLLGVVQRWKAEGMGRRVLRWGEGCRRVGGGAVARTQTRQRADLESSTAAVQMICSAEAAAAAASEGKGGTQWGGSVASCASPTPAGCQEHRRQQPQSHWPQPRSHPLHHRCTVRTERRRWVASAT